MSKIAAYGTLREGFYNFNRFNVEKVGQHVIEGFQLWDLGPYPYAIQTNNPDDKMVVDILEADETTTDRITWMEEGAGYETKTVNINGEDCLIYLFEQPVRNTTQIKTGDYNDRGK